MSRNAFIFGLLVAVLLIIGLYRAKDGARDSSAEIVQLETQIAEAYRQKALLEAELAHLSRREWIEEYARKELGMAPARANQIANDYNLDLLVGRPLAEGERAQQSQSVADPSAQPGVPGPNGLDADNQAETDLVPVPVTDASNPEGKEATGPK